MKNNYSIQNNFKLPKHRKKEYSLDLRNLDSSKLSINENFNTSTKKNININENLKFSPLETFKTVDHKEKMMNAIKYNKISHLILNKQIIDTQKKDFYLDRNDERKTIKVFPQKIEREKKEINPKMQFLKKYLNDNEIRFTPKKFVHYFNFLI